MNILAEVNFRTVALNEVARGPLNKALRGPLKTGGPGLQPCQPSGKSSPVRISSFRNLSLLVTSLISPRTLITAACTLLVVADVNVHVCVSQPNKRRGRKTLLYSLLLLQLLSVHTCLSAVGSSSRPNFTIGLLGNSLISV